MTSIEVDAPPEDVWRHVVSFPSLSERPEWYFQLGMAARRQIPPRATPPQAAQDSCVRRPPLASEVPPDDGCHSIQGRTQRGHERRKVLIGSHGFEVSLRTERDARSADSFTATAPPAATPLRGGTADGRGSAAAARARRWSTLGRSTGARSRALRAPRARPPRASPRRGARSKGAAARTRPARAR